MNIVNIDHIVLTVRNIADTVKFYESVLGMTREIYDDGRIALKFGNQKINLHEYGREIDPKASQPLPGSEDLCFITDTQIETVMENLKSKGIYILEGPVKRTGATGPIISIYCRDPDGNLIEIANYAEGT